MAGFLQYLGNSQLKFGPVEVHYGPKGCTSSFRVFCPYINPLITYYQYIIQFGASGTFKGLDVGVDGSTSAEDKELSVEVPGVVGSAHGITELFFDQWELLTNECGETIFRNPLIVGGGSPVLNYNDKTVLSRLARDGGTLVEAIASCTNDATITAPSTTNTLTPPNAGNGGVINPAGGSNPTYVFQAPAHGTAAEQLAKEIINGQSEYGKPTYVLRHTSYCSANQTYDAAIANVMKIYSPSQLLTECGSGWTYNLPARLYSKISSIPTEVAPTDEASYYTFGWLKKITREPVLSNFMVEVSTEFELGLWSNLRYELAS